MRVRSARAPRAGFTSVELLISSLLMASLMLVAGLATERALALFRQRRATDQVSSAAHRLLQRVATELVFARRATLLPVPALPLGASGLTYQRSLGVEAGAVQWGPSSTVRWEGEPGELDDGLDNDGDGLIDEGQLAWIESEGLPQERRVTWGHGLCELLPGETLDGTDEDGDGLIDERGLCFSIEGDVLTIRLGLQGRGPDGRVITRVAQTSVLVRN